MLKWFDDKLKNFRERVCLEIVKNQLEINGLDFERVDHLENTFLVHLKDPILCFVFWDKKKHTLTVESTLILDKEMADLNNLSKISDISMFFGFGASGYSPLDEGAVQIFISKSFHFNGYKGLALDLDSVEECIGDIIKEIYLKPGEADFANLDLSMFEGIDLDSIDLKELASTKRFGFKTWQKYLEKISSEQEDGFEDVLKLVKACALFEDTNEVDLCDLGDVVMEELIWNRELISTSREEEFQIN